MENSPPWLLPLPFFPLSSLSFQELRFLSTCTLCSSFILNLDLSPRIYQGFMIKQNKTPKKQKQEFEKWHLQLPESS